MMKLGLLLRSPARVEVLRALRCQPGAIGLRRLSRLAGVHPHSVEVALRSALAEKLVSRERRSRRWLYRMNRDHRDTAILEAVFAAAEKVELNRRSRALAKRAGTLLPFMKEAHRMISHARREEADGA